MSNFRILNRQKTFCPNKQPTGIDIFCRVIDNFGDAGVLWRIARELKKSGYAVRFIVDEPETLARLAGFEAQTPTPALGEKTGITVFRWERSWDEGACPLSPSEVVIEGFACRLPPAFELAMAEQKRPPLWINVDYFSAEDWVDSYHGQVSIHPQLGLKKYFFFPGVSPNSGGLTIEKDYLEQEKRYGGTARREGEPFRVFFFAYPYGPIKELALAFLQCTAPLTVSCAMGGAGQKLFECLSKPHSESVCASRLSFVEQERFDRLLWNNDILFVRGEDSVARAMLSGKPFIWHIYHQDDGAHRTKLEALTEKMRPYFDDATLFELWSRFQYEYNEGRVDAVAWKALLQGYPDWAQSTLRWRQRLFETGSLTSKLSEMIKNTLK